MTAHDNLRPGHKITRIDIRATCWQNRNGNSYHVVRGTVTWDDGHTEDIESRKEYGGLSGYLRTAADQLDSECMLPGRVFTVRHGTEQGEPLWQYCDRNGIRFDHGVTDVKRERDL